VIARYSNSLMIDVESVKTNIMHLSAIEHQTNLIALYFIK